MAPPLKGMTTLTSAPAVHQESVPIGPHTGIFSIQSQYIPERDLRHMLRSIGYDEPREDSYRLRGVQLIDSVRESLHLPVKTFDTAATYYHKFRIRFPSVEYNYEDAALASLFVACKVEDTIKKSKEILCAAHNLRQPHDQRTPDDKHFEHPSKFVIGLERHILETIGFDFRVQYPQKHLIKMIRDLFPQSTSPHNSCEDNQASAFLRMAHDMSIDLYKTFAPIKQTTSTMVLAILELTHLVRQGEGVQTTSRIQRFLDWQRWHTSRVATLETMLDLLDLYTQFPKQTRVGARTDLTILIEIKIALNRQLEGADLPRFDAWCDPCVHNEALDSVTPGSATSPATNSSFPPATGGSGGSGGGGGGVGLSVKRGGRTNEGTMRFVFNAEEARKERDLVTEYFVDEYEEHEVEVEEPMMPDEPASAPSQNGPGRQSGGHHSSGRNGQAPHSSHRSSNTHGDNRWDPYHRNGRNGALHPDRHKGRKGYR